MALEVACVRIIRTKVADSIAVEIGALQCQAALNAAVATGSVADPGGMLEQ